MAGRRGGCGARPGGSPRLPSPADSVDCLVKQLSEAFGFEAASPAAACPAQEAAAEEPARRSCPPAGGPEAAAVVSGEEAERPPSPSASAAPVRPARLAGPGFSSGKCLGGVCVGGGGHAPVAPLCVGGCVCAFSRPTCLQRPCLFLPLPRFSCLPPPGVAWSWGSAAAGGWGSPLGNCFSVKLISLRS